jgi:hypothetical protein
LLEHWAFCLFYNWPLTIRRRIRRRSQVRASKAPRYWHVPICAVAGAAAFGLADSVSLHLAGELPTLRDLWWLVATVAILCGAGVTLGCGGVALGRRIVAAAASGVLMAAIYVGVSAVLGCGGSLPGGIVAICVWRVFVFAILSTLGAIGAELLLPHPDLR